jgi:hypothetical protein
MSTSVVMLKAALAYQFAVREMQVPGRVRSQARWMGVHCQMDEAVVPSM